MFKIGANVILANRTTPDIDDMYALTFASPKGSIVITSINETEARASFYKLMDQA